MTLPAASVTRGRRGPTATFFLDDVPSEELRERLGFREEPRGANLWLVIPNDLGVFQGAELRDGVRCVHPCRPTWT